MINSTLLERLATAEIAMYESRLKGIQTIEQNKMGAEITRFSDVHAFSIRHIPGPSYNVVKGSWTNAAATLPAISRSYKEKRIPLRIEIAPHEADTACLLDFHQAGLYQSDAHATLYSELEEMDRIKLGEDSITIRKIGRGDFGQYGHLYTKGFGMPAFLAESVAANNEVLLDLPGWHFFIASNRKRDVGVAALFITGDIAILAASAVIPEGRNHKVHQALIDHRLQMAKELGCQLVCGHAKFASVSQNNMERCGLKLAYLKNIWQEAPVKA